MPLPVGRHQPGACNGGQVPLQHAECCDFAPCCNKFNSAINGDNAHKLRITAMLEATNLMTHQTAHQRRLRAITQRLVIELGYLEHCLAAGLPDPHMQSAAAGIDAAIDCLNEHLERVQAQL